MTDVERKRERMRGRERKRKRMIERERERERDVDGDVGFFKCRVGGGWFLIENVAAGNFFETYEAK